MIKIVKAHYLNLVYGDLCMRSTIVLIVLIGVLIALLIYGFTMYNMLLIDYNTLKENYTKLMNEYVSVSSQLL